VLDPAEKTDVAAENLEKVTELEKRAEELARQSVPPLLLTETLGLVKRELMGTVSLPDDVELKDQP
jgi:hypothetical protein